MPSWATSEAVRRSMQANRPRDTIPEVAFRSALHRSGLRFFKNRRPVAGLRCEPDVVFPRAHVAVFLDGCFWHGCPEHASMPKTNGEWWARKLAATQMRDALNDTTLRQEGWTVVRIWEHEGLASAVEKVKAALSEARHSASPSSADS